MQRDNYLDFLKGYAAILVIFQHLMAMDAMGPSEYVRGIYNIVHYSHMPIFFLISGYFAVNIERLSYKEICKKKAPRFLMPFLSWTLVAVIAGNLYRLKDGLNIDICQSIIKEYVDNILWAKSMWFFLCIFEVFILAKFLLHIFGENKVLTVIFYGILLCVPVPGSMLAFNMAKEFICFFLIGFWLNRFNVDLQDRKAIMKKFYGYFILGIIIVIIILLAFNPNFIFWSNNVFFKIGFELLCLPVSMCVICPSLFRLKNISKYGTLIGRYSMECYCIHMMFVKYIVISIPFLRECIIAGILLNLCKAVIIAIICVIISKYVLNKVMIYRKIMLGDWNFTYTNK